MKHTKRTSAKTPKRQSNQKTVPQRRTKSSVPRAVSGGQKEKVLVGTVEGNQKGYGFLVVPGSPEDAFIPARAMNGAVHGDTVEAVLTGNSGRGGEAEVVKVLSRRYSTAVGTFFRQGDRGIVIPDEQKIAAEIMIADGHTMGAKHLDKVVVTPDYANRNRYVYGKITEVLGGTGEKGIDILSIIRSYNLYETFPPAVLKEANRVAAEPMQEEIARRTDFRNELIFTIDGDDSRDFDDAVGLTRLPNGNFRLGVHIADVAHYTASGSAMDKEAFRRGTSVYFCDRVLPMLPEKLSNDICSLNENADRLTLSIIMEIDGTGTVADYKICEGVIKSRFRMTYSKVHKILDGDKDLCKAYQPIVPALSDMLALSKILYAKRKNRGNIDFDLPECELILDSAGKCVDIRRKERLISHRIIEEFMLMANETVAKHFFKLKAPFVYRAHEKPPAEKTETLMDFLQSLGISFPGDSEKPSPSDFNKLLKQVENSPYKTAVEKIALRTMSKACYQSENIGHFGLAAEFYCHFTSPIRRYPDLAIHRVIKDYLVNGNACFNKHRAFVTAAGTQSSERERLAEKAERDVEDLKKTEYMSDKIGRRFTGIISGVTEWGIFVELENTVEGMVRIENLPGDGYEYDRKSARLTNRMNSYRIGDTAAVEVMGTNGLKIEFKLCENKAP